MGCEEEHRTEGHPFVSSPALVVSNIPDSEASVSQYSEHLCKTESLSIMTCSRHAM